MVKKVLLLSANFFRWWKTNKEFLFRNIIHGVFLLDLNETHLRSLLFISLSQARDSRHYLHLFSTTQICFYFEKWILMLFSQIYHLLIYLQTFVID